MANKIEGRELRIRGYSKETALCVEVALSALEDDVRNELADATESAGASLRRVLLKIEEHRKVLERFTKAA